MRVNIVKIQSQPFQKRGPNFLTFVLFGVLATFRGFLGLWQPQKVKLQLADVEGRYEAKKGRVEVSNKQRCATWIFACSNCAITATDCLNDNKSGDMGLREDCNRLPDRQHEKPEPNMLTFNSHPIFEEARRWGMEWGTDVENCGEVEPVRVHWLGVDHSKFHSPSHG